MAAYYDITTNKGSAFRHHFKLMSEGNTGIDLGSSNPKMQVRKSPLGNDIVLDFTTAGVTVNYYGLTGQTFSQFSFTGGIDTNTSYLGISGDTGGLYVYAPANIMQNAEIGNWTYSLSCTISGDQEDLIQGRFAVEWNATV
jgi:hypothetical protein